MIENKAQSRAISHHQGPMLVLAGPGSGKTHVITQRIAYLIETYQVRPEEILVITFTKYAAKEMKERFQKSFRSNVPVTFGTFHGIFYGILKWAYGIGSENILSEEQRTKLIKEILASTEIEESFAVEMDDEKEWIANIGREISMVKSDGIDPEQFQSKECPAAVFQTIYQAYERIRKENRKIDFDDMILQCYRLFQANGTIRKQWQGKYKYILIDEFQDINQMQFATIQMLAEPENNIFVVGDDDQSIYRFRGAKPEIMLGFTQVYPDAQQVVLDTNYRSTKAIVNGATKVIGHNQNRYRKQVQTPNEQGDTVHVQEVKDPIEEAEYILHQIQNLQKQGVPNSEIAMLFRTNLDASVLAGKMIAYGVPFQMREHLPNIYEHFIATNLMAYAQMVTGKRERHYFLQIMNRPNRYIARDVVDQGPVNFENLRKYYWDKDWMQDRIDQFEVDLRVMKNMTPFAFIQYVRKRVGYEGFLKEYAEYRHLNYPELLETLEEIQQQAKSFSTIGEWLTYIKDYSEQLKQQVSRQQQVENAISFHTMHGAKGLEFDYVFLIAGNEGVTPSKKAKLPEEIEEERRMFYVAMTRARKKLTISYPIKKHGKDLHPSRFIHELLRE